MVAFVPESKRIPASIHIFASGKNSLLHPSIDV